MTDAAIFLLSLLGFLFLLSAFPRHQQDWLRCKLGVRTSRLLRLAGFLSLAIALVVAAMGFGWGYGPILWLGWLTVAAAIVVAAHTNRDRIVARIRG